MEDIRKKLKDQSGMALVFALLITMVLAVAALSSIMVTNTGLKTVSQFKIHQKNMYLADEGAEMGFGILVKVKAEGEIDTIEVDNEMLLDANNNVTFGTPANLENLYKEITGTDDGGDSYTDATPDIRYDVKKADGETDLGTINIDIDFVRPGTDPGCGNAPICRYFVFRVDSQMVPISGDSSVVRIYYKCRNSSGGGCL